MDGVSFISIQCQPSATMCGMTLPITGAYTAFVKVAGRGFFGFRSGRHQRAGYSRYRLDGSQRLSGDTPQTR